MNCKQISEQLIDYIDLKLDRDTAEKVKKHISECKKCRKEYTELKVLFGNIEQNVEIKPSISLKNNFIKMIEVEKKLQSSQSDSKVIQLRIPNKRVVLQIAAAIALLITGFLSGYQFKDTGADKSIQTAQLTEMKNDVDEMKRMMVFNLLKNESASQRIQAVNYTEELINPDSDIIMALINTLNSDKSTNVRLAAVYSLARFKTNNTVKKAFIETLNKQDDPMIQIVIINVLVEMEEVKAVDELQNLLNNKDLNEQVKKQAEMGVEILS